LLHRLERAIREGDAAGVPRLVEDLRAHGSEVQAVRAV
jgi:hypothetical protein